MMSRATTTMAVRVIITGGIFAVFSAMSYAVIMGHVTQAQALRDVVMIVIGSIITHFGNAMNYWLGTSQGSADKTHELSGQTKGKRP